jgi:PAS domain S-box-containing protein
MKAVLADNIFRNAFYCSPVATGITDLAGNWKHVNRRLCHLTGFTEAALLNRNIEDLIYISDEIMGRGCRTNAIEGVDQYSVEVRMVVKSGEVVWVNMNVAIVRDDAQVPLYFIKEFEDITEKINSTRRCTVRENQLRLFIENCPLPAALFDSEMNYLMVSKAWYRDHRISEDSVIGKNHFEIFKDIKREWKQYIYDCLNGVDAQREDDILVRSDGRIEWVSWKILPWYNAENEVGGIIMFTEAVTDKKEAQIKFHDLVENFVSGIYIYQNNNLVYVNDTFLKMFGLDYSGELKVDLLKDVLHRADLKIAESFLLSRLTSEDKNARCEVRGVKDNSNVIWMELSGSRTIYKGHPAIIGSIADITQRKKNELDKLNTVRLLNQRFNELSLLYRISQILNREGLDKFEVLTRLTHIIPEGFQYSDIARCRIIADGLEVHPADYRNDLHKHTVKFSIDIGRRYEVEIEIAYIKGVGIHGGEIFVPEEKKLMEMMAEMLRLYLTRKLYMKQIITEKILSDSIINSLPGVFYILSRNGYFIRWNRELEVASGYTSEEISKLSPADFYSPEDSVYMEGKIREVFEKGDSKAEVLAMTKDGRKVPYYFFAQRIVYEGEPALIGTGLNVAELKETETKLKESYEKLRMLAAHIEDIREEEKMSIAREIHDELGQRLTVLKFELTRLAEKPGTLTDEAQEKLGEALLLLDETAVLVRQIATELRPGLLDDIGLVAALKWQSMEFERRTGIRSEFAAEENDNVINAELSTSFFRIYQESLTNVARHSKATLVTASLEITDDRLILKISDNGQGFDLNQIAGKKTLGLLGIEERAIRMGGHFAVNSSPGNGTVIEVSATL